jgi:RNA polymerase sigma-70 factor (ECF subfamily)
VFEDDKQLVRRLLAGDERGFEQFFGRYSQLLAAFVLRRTRLDRAAVEDVVQNAMIRAVRSLGQYRGEASLLTWMCQIARSELADQQRRDQRRPQLASYDADARLGVAVEQIAAAEAAGPAAGFGEGVHSEAVWQTLAGLPERQARVLELKYGDDLSVEEIAVQMGMTVTAAQSLLARARSAFRDAWQQTHPSGEH